MVDISAVSVKWYLIIIDDPELLSGHSVLNFFTDLIKKFPFKFVVLDYIYGLNTPVLAELEKDIIDINEILKLLPKVIQLDWGDFFLFNEYPKDWVNHQNMLYPSVIQQTDCTVRAVDDQYIYIYTPKQEVVNYIQSLSRYNIESIDFDFLDNLSYPE